MSAWTLSIFLCEKLKVFGHIHEEWNNRKSFSDLICRHGNAPWRKNLKPYFGKGARQIFKAQTEMSAILHISITLKMLLKLQNRLMLNIKNRLMFYFTIQYTFSWCTIWICFKWLFSSFGHSFVESYLFLKVVCRTKKYYIVFFNCKYK